MYMMRWLATMLMVCIVGSTVNRNVLKLDLDVDTDPDIESKNISCNLLFKKHSWQRYVDRNYNRIRLKSQCDLFLQPNNYTFNVGFPNKIAKNKYEVKIDRPPSFLELYGNQIRTINNNNELESDSYSGGVYKVFSFNLRILKNKRPRIGYQQCFNLIGQGNNDKLCFRVNIFNKIAIQRGPVIVKEKVVDIGKKDILKRNLWIYLYNGHLGEACQWYLPRFRQYQQQRQIVLDRSRREINDNGRFDFLPSSADQQQFLDGYNEIHMFIRQSVNLKFKYICQFDGALKNTELNVQVNIV